MDFLLGKSQGASLDYNGDKIIDIADLIYLLKN
jgi:hypothetical protein